MTEEKFMVPKHFAAATFFDRSLGVMTGTGDYEVMIEQKAGMERVF